MPFMVIHAENVCVYFCEIIMINIFNGLFQIKICVIFEFLKFFMTQKGKKKNQRNLLNNAIL